MNASSPPSAAFGDAALGRRESSARDYVDLLKPRVMSLVVFTALTGYAAAPQTAPGGIVMAFAAILAIAVGAGAAGALNMWWDADIDAKMGRTAKRPVPAGKVSREEAAGFGAVLSVLSVVTMWLAGGWLAASLLAFTIFFYVIVYTIALKRRTAQNIVIGGLAGALPPVIGWAAASGTAPLAPWVLVALIFFWTPPHFWALALYKAGDYAKAGVPMLPVTAGDRATRRQIFAYVLALGPLTAAPLFVGLGGIGYGVAGGLSYAGLLLLAIRVLRGGRAKTADEPGPSGLYEAKDPAARDLFAYSILYLFALFAALLVEGVTA